MAAIAVLSSGRDVPRAIIVAAMISFGTPNRLAVSTAAGTSSRDAIITKTRPPKNSRRIIGRGFGFSPTPTSVLV